MYDISGDLLYNGNFCDDFPNDGKFGKIFYSNGNLAYFGAVKNGKRCGKGIEYCSESLNGNVVFKGCFYEDFRHGRGVELDENGVVKAVGIWEYGRRNRVVCSDDFSNFDV